MTDNAGSQASGQPGRTHAIGRWRAVILLSLLLPAVGLAIAAGWLYRQEFADTHVRLDRSARIAQEHALKLFDTNEMLLQRMADLLDGPSDEALLARGAELHARLQRMADSLPQVQGLFAFGADARMLASSRVYPPLRDIDYSDRAWYRAHRQAGAPPLYVSDLIKSRATGEAAFDMSRRRVAPGGAFNGTVHVSLRPEYLTDFYRELAAAEPGLRMAVLRTDGALIARWPDAAQPGQSVPPDDMLMLQIAAGAVAGDNQSASSFDATQRVRAFRRLGGYPLVVVSAIDRSVVLAAWQRRVALAALFLVSVALVFAGSAWLALRRTRDELDALARLEQETERRQRAELALVQSQKLEAMGNLTGGVAHDFNNLLMVISSNAELLRRRQPELAASSPLQAIGRAVDSGAKLTRQLLAFARKQALMPQRISLQERLPGLVELLRPLLGANIELDWRVDEATAPIHVDAAELELALINLAINARDAMQGRGRLSIHARNASSAELPPPLSGAFVLIEVQDTGIGFDAAVAARAFEPFFTTKPLGKGTGLGLAQVRALCQSAGGEARIETGMPGGGARVSLFLGRSSAAAQAAATVAPRAPAIYGCLLLVEDNDEVANATRALLESMGCQVLRAANAQQALDLVAAHPTPIDAVLSDIEMPGGSDGIALALRLRERQPPIPTVLMTGYAARLEQAMRQQLEVLPKPCTPQALAQAIGKVLARRWKDPQTA